MTREEIIDEVDVRSRGAERDRPSSHTRRTAHRITEWAERIRLVRYWERYGPMRPMLITCGGDSVWVVENKTSARRRFIPLSSNPRLDVYQLNQQTGEWTHTRSRSVCVGGVVEVLEKDDKRVMKAWRWVLTKRLTNGGAA